MDSQHPVFDQSQMEDEAIDGPDDLTNRLEFVGKQIKWLHQLNARFSTHYTNLSRAIDHGKRAGLIETTEYTRLLEINRCANNAKHHDLGDCATTPDHRRCEEYFDGADLGIINVLKASSVQQQELTVREIYLLGLARDPEKDRMGTGIKKEMNRRLYKLQRKGHVVTRTPGRWCFKSEIPEAALSKSSDVASESDSVLPSSFGALKLDKSC